MYRNDSIDTRDIDTIYNQKWKSQLENEDGTINMNMLKKVLCDYAYTTEQVDKVYGHITNNSMTEGYYEAHDVINEADDYYESLHREAYAEKVKEIIDNEYDSDSDKLNDIRDFFDL